MESQLSNNIRLSPADKKEIDRRIKKNTLLIFVQLLCLPILIFLVLQGGYYYFALGISKFLWQVLTEGIGSVLNPRDYSYIVVPLIFLGLIAWVIVILLSLVMPYNMVTLMSKNSFLKDFNKLSVINTEEKNLLEKLLNNKLESPPIDF